MKNIIKTLFFILLIAIITISSIIVLKNNYEDTEQERIIEQVTDTAYQKNDTDDYKTENININMKSLYEQNKDIIAWIRINNSNINYPIMQTKNNPNFYLRKNFYKAYSYYGTPYLSEQCNINTSDNLIVYGHHIKNSKMFGEFENYKRQEYYNNHKIVNIYTLNDKRKYEIIYIFKTIINKGFDYYNYINFNDESEFNTFKNKCEKLAFFNTQIECDYKDKFITLSTCDYTSENARLVIVAKMIK